MNQDIKRLIQLSTLRDVQMKLKEEQLDGQIIPDVVFEAIRAVEDSYDIPEDDRNTNPDPTPEDHICAGDKCKACHLMGNSI